MSSISVAGDSSGAISIAAPSAAGSGVLTLPVIAADTLAGIAATQTLTNKTLVAPALGTPASGVLTNCTGVVASALPAGSVLQVVNAIKSDRFTTTSSTFVDITGYSATITPNFATSKILVISSFHVSNGAIGAYVRAQLLRGATPIGLGNASGSATQITSTSSITNSADPDILNSSYTYLDSPATTSATTYKWQMATFSSRTGTFNGSTGTSGSNYYNSSSTITLMEIAA
jgi:hypothetical protein